MDQKLGFHSTTSFMFTWKKNYLFFLKIFLNQKKLPPPPFLWLIMESNSSRKMVEGWWNLANSNSTLTNFSESPLHLLTIEDADILKKVVLHSVATAFASIVFFIEFLLIFFVDFFHCFFSLIFLFDFFHDFFSWFFSLIFLIVFFCWFFLLIFFIDFFFIEFFSWFFSWNFKKKNQRKSFKNSKKSNKKPFQFPAVRTKERLSKALAVLWKNAGISKAKALLLLAKTSHFLVLRYQRNAHSGFQCKYL